MSINQSPSATSDPVSYHGSRVPEAVLSAVAAYDSPGLRPVSLPAEFSLRDVYLWPVHPTQVQIRQDLSPSEPPKRVNPHTDPRYFRPAFPSPSRWVPSGGTPWHVTERSGSGRAHAHDVSFPLARTSNRIRCCPSPFPRCPESHAPQVAYADGHVHLPHCYGTLTALNAQCKGLREVAVKPRKKIGRIVGAPCVIVGRASGFTAYGHSAPGCGPLSTVARIAQAQSACTVGFIGADARQIGRVARRRQVVKLRRTIGSQWPGPRMQDR